MADDKKMKACFKEGGKKGQVILASTACFCQSSHLDARIARVRASQTRLTDIFVHHDDRRISRTLQSVPSVESPAWLLPWRSWLGCVGLAHGSSHRQPHEADDMDRLRSAAFATANPLSL